MDDKKKFEIEFDDDFDSWLAQHEQATKDLKPSAPSQPNPAVSEKPMPSTPAQHKPAASVNPEPAQPKQDSQQFKPVSSNSGSDIPVSRREVVKNFKLQIDEEEYNKPAYEEPAQPVKRDKSVYFAGRKP